MDDEDFAARKIGAILADSHFGYVSVLGHDTSPRFTPTIFWTLVLVSILTRVLLVGTSIGTTDVIFKTFWANLIEHHGISGAYAKQDLINEAGIRIALFPPLTLLTFKGMIGISRLTGLEFTDVFRLVQVLADVLVAILLLPIARRQLPASADPRLPVLFYLLCPAVIFISAFHCNTDSTMVSLMVVSIAVVHRGAGGAGAAGVALAAATGIKVLPLFLVPFFLIALRRPRLVAVFSAGWAITMTAIFMPAALIGGNQVIDRILSYSGYPSSWGIHGLLRQLGESTAFDVLERAAEIYFSHGKYAVISAISIFLLWIASRMIHRKVLIDPQRLLTAAFPIVYLLALALAPGFGPQYLLWPIPFLPFLFGWRDSLIIAGVFSLHLFIVYTLWSGGFPWWFAAAPQTDPELQKLSGLVTWLVVLWSIGRGLKRMKSVLAAAPPGPKSTSPSKTRTTDHGSEVTGTTSSSVVA